MRVVKVDAIAEPFHRHIPGEPECSRGSPGLYGEEVNSGSLGAQAHVRSRRKQPSGDSQYLEGFRVDPRHPLRQHGGGCATGGESGNNSRFRGILRKPHHLAVPVSNVFDTEVTELALPLASRAQVQPDKYEVRGQHGQVAQPGGTPIEGGAVFFEAGQVTAGTWYYDIAEFTRSCKRWFRPAQ